MYKSKFIVGSLSYFCMLACSTEAKTSAPVTLPAVPTSVTLMLDSYFLPPANSGRSEASDIGMDDNGNLYVVGHGNIYRSDRTVVRKSADGGKTWTTVDGLQSTSSLPGAFVLRPMFAKDSMGNLYTAGAGEGAIMVRKSMDGGNTWVTANKFQLAPGLAAEAFAMTIHDDEIYVAGSAISPPVGGRAWIVRKSSDGGSTWETIDYFGDFDSNGAMVGYAAANGIGFDPKGNLYVVGCTKSGQTCLVRKSSDKGKTWTMVGIGGAVLGEPGFHIDNQGNIYVATQSHNAWTVQRSSDQGETWSTIDSFHLNGKEKSGARAVTVDDQGYIYVGGYGMKGKQDNWVMRKSIDNGATWTTVDLKLDPRQRQMLKEGKIQALMPTADGGIILAGFSGSYWIVRKLTIR